MFVDELKLPGVKLLKPPVFQDDRGYFFETYRQSRYKTCGIPTSFVQDNHSLSSYQTLRGMHFQSTPGQDKLVTVLQGEIFDCIVDMRPHSPTFKQWVGVYLSDKNHHQVYLPKGCGHGFLVLSPQAHVIYKVSSDYRPETEKGFRFDDPEIGIQWPLKNPHLSKRDQEAPSFQSCMECEGVFL